jgi:hypothetical protein
MSEANPQNPAAPASATPLIHRDIFTLEKGHLVVQWPDELTAAEYADIVEWTAIWLRKMKRHSDRNTERSANGSASRGNPTAAGARA